jgi:gas vesicle protein
MAKTHKNAKEFLLGAFIGSVVGIAAVSLTSSKGKKNKHLVQSLTKIASLQGDGELAEFIDWTTEGIQLWNKLKKGK